MKRVFLLLGAGIAGMFLLLVAGGALFPFPDAPRSLHRWLPVPVACAGSSCVTYAQWSVGVDRLTKRRSPVDVLTVLLEERAITVVAFREGVRVSSLEVEQALGAVRSTLDGVPGGTEMLRDVYGTYPEQVLRDGLRALLLREKLAAQGLSSPWEGSNPPRVTIWNIHLRWDASRHVVVSQTSSGALAREQKMR